MDFVLGLLPGFGSVLAVIVVIVAIVLILKNGYVKAPPDVAYIISGLRKEPRVIVGKAAIKVPFFERVDMLSLRLIKVDVKTQESVPTAEFINVNVDSVVMAKVPNEPEMIKKAAMHFLNVNEATIGSAIVDVLEGNTREIVGSMKLRDMISDRKAFGERVQENAVPDLKAMGVELLSFTVQGFNDRNGVIEDLGIENTAQIKKTASIAKAEADRDVAIAQAEASRKAAEAQAEADKRIAEKANEVAVKKAELKIISDSKAADADAAYDIQCEVQRKTKEVASVDADIAKEERKVALKEREAAVKEQELNAEMKKAADAQLYAQQKSAEANLYREQKEADAQLYRQEKEAAAVFAMASKEAEAIRMKGAAEADAIKAKGEAEAAAMEKKAEAYKKYTGAAMLEMMVNVLPEVAKNVAEPLKQIDRITIFGNGENNGMGVAGNVPQAIGYAFETMKEATGIDMKDIVRANSIEAKVNRNINLDCDVNATAVPAAKSAGNNDGEPLK